MHHLEAINEVDALPNKWLRLDSFRLCDRRRLHHCHCVGRHNRYLLLVFDRLDHGVVPIFTWRRFTSYLWRLLQFNIDLLLSWGIHIGAFILWSRLLLDLLTHLTALTLHLGILNLATLALSLHALSRCRFCISTSQTR